MRVAFLRGINVGGRNRLPMKGLEAALRDLGAREVRTYLQSGNVVFEGPDLDPATLAERLADAVMADHGFRPRTLVLEAAGLERVVHANPYPQATAEPKSLHLFFPLEPPAEPDLTHLEGVRQPTERYALTGGVLYLHAPEGIGRSKLAGRVDQALGVETTARNWRTASKVLRLARGDAPAG